MRDAAGGQTIFEYLFILGVVGIGVIGSIIFAPGLVGIVVAAVQDSIDSVL